MINAMKSMNWVLVPDTPSQIEQVTKQCRRLVTKRALMAAGVAAIPLPGIDWVTDIGVLMKLIPEINAAFGLTPEQVERLAPDRQVVVYKAISAGGGMLVGRLVTRELVIKVLKMIGVRLTTQTSREVRADRRSSGFGSLDVFGAEICLRTTHSAVHRRLATIDARPPRFPLIVSIQSRPSGRSAAW